MTGLTILGYVLIIFGVIIGFWGGVQFPFNIMNSEFMSFLVSMFVLITIGISLLKNVPNWLLLGLLWITVVLIIIYLYGFKMPILVLLAGIVVILGIGWWLTTLISK